MPGPVRGSSHSFRYSLFYGRVGQRLIAYDNEPGKEIIVIMATTRSHTTSPRQKLVADFLADVRATRRAHEH